MFDFRSPENSIDNERGLIGVGTLVVFISIVIVSSVAAGLLINSSLSLQQQARASTQETITQITSGVNILDAKGRTNENGEVDNIQVIIRPYPGAQEINLENTIIQFKTEDDVYYQNYDNSAGAPASDEFDVYKIQSTSGAGGTQLREMGDISRVYIQLTGEDALATNETASVTFVPNTGFKTYYKLFVPAATSPDEWYKL